MNFTMLVTAALTGLLFVPLVVTIAVLIAEGRGCNFV